MSDEKQIEQTTAPVSDEYKALPDQTSENKATPVSAENQPDQPVPTSPRWGFSPCKALGSGIVGLLGLAIVFGGSKLANTYVYDADQRERIQKACIFLGSFLAYGGAAGVLRNSGFCKVRADNAKGPALGEVKDSKKGNTAAFLSSKKSSPNGNSGQSPSVADAKTTGKPEQELLNGDSGNGQAKSSSFVNVETTVEPEVLHSSSSLNPNG